MSEVIRVFHATSGKVGRRVAEKRIDIYHAYRHELRTANLAAQMRDAVTFLSQSGVVLEYMVPSSLLIQVDHEDWYTPATILDRKNWKQIPTDYRVEMHRAGLIVSGTLNNPEQWPFNVEVAVLSAEYYVSTHPYVHAMLLAMRESSSSWST